MSLYYSIVKLQLTILYSVSQFFIGIFIEMLKSLIRNSPCIRRQCSIFLSRCWHNPRWYTVVFFQVFSPKLVRHFAFKSVKSNSISTSYCIIVFTVSHQKLTFICKSQSNALSLKERNTKIFGQKWAILVIVQCWQNPCRYSGLFYLVSLVDTRGL